MIGLKALHPILYARVRLKAIVNILLGLALIFPEFLPKGLDTKAASSSQLNYVLPLTVWGLFFLIIGLGIVVGLKVKTRDYKLARRFLFISFFYSLFWLLVLIGTTILGYPRTASIMILWGYWVYNQFLIMRDPGWKALQIIREIRSGTGDFRL